MTRSEKLSWTLGAVICAVIPLAFGHWREALAGTAALAVLWWRIAPWRNRER